MRVLLDGSALEGRGHRLTCQGRSRGHGLTPVLRVRLVERRLLDAALVLIEVGGGPTRTAPPSR